MKTNNQIILKKKKGQWWNIAANKPFSGFASINGQTFLYTKRNGGHLSRKVLRQLSEDFRTINHLA